MSEKTQLSKLASLFAEMKIPFKVNADSAYVTLQLFAGEGVGVDMPLTFFFNRGSEKFDELMISCLKEGEYRVDPWRFTPVDMCYEGNEEEPSLIPIKATTEEKLA